ncbi:hypothetical protein MRX96_018005 [Rhipicephalus microplus]
MYTSKHFYKVATLLYWLLKQHPCVTELELACGRLNVYEGLICDSLQGKTSLMKLNPRDTTHVGMGLRGEVCATFSNLTRLEEITCDTQLQCGHTLASALSNLVIKTEPLGVSGGAFAKLLNLN